MTLSSTSPYAYIVNYLCLFDSTTVELSILVYYKCQFVLINHRTQQSTLYLSNIFSSTVYSLSVLLGPTQHINRQPCNHTRATSTNRSGALLLHLCEDNGLAPNGLAPKTISPYSDVIIPVWFITFHLCSICSRGAKCCIHKLWFLWPKAGSPSAACRLSWFSSTN